MMKTLLPALFLIISSTAPVQALRIAKPGFNCPEAQSDLEKAMCAHAEIIEADHAMRFAYSFLQSEAPDSSFSKALMQDQKNFLAIREAAFNLEQDTEQAAKVLLDATELRAEFLNWINSEPPEGLKGTWANAWGQLTIKEAADGTLTLSANVVDQVAGAWLCGYEGDLNAVSPFEAFGATLTETLHLRREGNLIEVTNHFCDETGPAINGSMKGYYFRIGAED